MGRSRSFRRPHRSLRLLSLIDTERQRFIMTQRPVTTEPDNTDVTGKFGGHAGRDVPVLRPATRTGAWWLRVGLHHRPTVAALSTSRIPLDRQRLQIY
jgi:hypothetical protein